METGLQVRLVKYTPDPERTCAEAARLCYSPISVEEMGAKLSREEIEKTLKHVLKAGHTSVVEHAVFTFAVEGISRACSHQLVRHRIASYSQQSQRYVSGKNFRFIVPESVKRAGKEKEFEDFMARAGELYEDFTTAGIAKEDARFVLPNAAETRIVVTMNARALLNFFELRCCTNAQWEIRGLANEMLRLVKEVAPIIFENAGPKCVSRKVCTEGKRSCGKWKTIPGAILRE